MKKQKINTYINTALEKNIKFFRNYG